VAWEGLTNEQLAQVLGCSRAVVKLRLHRARRRFARRLSEAGVEIGPHAAGTGLAGAAARPELAPGAASIHPVRHAAARVELKPRAAAGHVISGRAPARPGTEEA